MGTSFESLDEFYEIDYRQSGEVKYYLYWYRPSNGLMLDATDPQFERAIEVPIDEGRDAMLHPEPRLCKMAAMTIQLFRTEFDDD